MNNETKSFLSSLGSLFGARTSKDDEAAKWAAEVVTSEVRRRQSDCSDQPQGYYVEFSASVKPEVIRLTANRLRRLWHVESDDGIHGFRIVLRHSGAYRPYQTIELQFPNC
jgi:hypothetical protein